jgi:hypothetical protein
MACLFYARACGQSGKRAVGSTGRRLLYPGGRPNIYRTGIQETTSMAILKDYFGALPFSRYTVLFRNTIPRPDDEPGNFGMEHLQSSTFFGDTSEVRTGKLPEKQLWETIPTYLLPMYSKFRL